MNSKIPDIGQTPPDFEAVTSDEEIFRLRDVLGSGKIIKIVFYRGHW